MKRFRVITGDDPSSCEAFDTFEAAQVYLEEHAIPDLREVHRGESEWEAPEEAWAEIVELRERHELVPAGTTEPDPEADPPEEPTTYYDLLPVDLAEETAAPAADDQPALPA